MKKPELKELKEMQINPPAPQLSRQQRRYKERIESEANQTYASITKKFFNYLVTHDNPTGQEVADRIEQISAQWKMYCRKMNLVKDVYDMFDKYANGLLEEYLKTKSEVKE